MHESLPTCLSPVTASGRPSNRFEELLLGKVFRQKGIRFL